MKQKVLCIVGPTGVGKTDFSISISKKLKAEIISADSMQIYKFMNIGTAKPSIEQLNIVKHHLIDIIEPDKPFNVKDYVLLAEKTVAEIYSRNKFPIIVGGTGLYFKGLLNGIFDAPIRNDELRRAILKEIEEIGLENVYKNLAKVDPVAANRIHPNDKKRIIRALEIYKLTGKPISILQIEQATKFNTPYNYIFIGVTDERDKIYNRIEERCDKMLNSGFVQEVIELRGRGYHSNLQSMKAIGYNHINKYLDKLIDYDEMVRTFKRDSRRYAKRQWTLFNSIKEVNWIKINWNDNIFEQIPKKINLF